jgi:membrane-bound ClpP family serine protease
LLGLSELALPGAGAVGVGLVLGIIGAGFAFALFALLQRFEAAEPTTLAALAGRSGQVAVSITHGRPGQVKLLVDGALRSFTAVSEDDLRTGEPALIVAVDGVRLVVRRPTA